MPREPYTSVVGGHPAKITPAYGVAPDAAGSVRLRIVAFRAHCATCGYLGKRRANWHVARNDTIDHKRATRPEPDEDGR